MTAPPPPLRMQGGMVYDVLMFNITARKLSEIQAHDWITLYSIATAPEERRTERYLDEVMEIGRGDLYELAGYGLIDRIDQSEDGSPVWRVTLLGIAYIKADVEIWMEDADDDDDDERAAKIRLRSEAGNFRMARTVMASGLSGAMRMYPDKDIFNPK